MRTLFPFDFFCFAHFKYYSRSICIRCMYIFFVERFTICLYNEQILWRDKGRSQNKTNKLQVYSANAVLVRLLSLSIFFSFKSVVHTHAFVQRTILLQFSHKMGKKCTKLKITEKMLHKCYEKDHKIVKSISNRQSQNRILVVRTDTF